MVSSQSTHPRSRRRWVVGAWLSVVLVGLGACSIETGPTATGALSCGSQLTFDEADLVARGGLGKVDGASDALSAFLASEDARNANLSGFGWTRVSDREDAVLFIAGTPATGFMMVAVSQRSGRWAAEEWGECRPTAEHPDLDAAVWDLAAEPEATSTQVLAVAAAGFCAGDGPLDTRLRPPSVAYASDSITVTLWVTSVAPRSEVSACVGGLFTPVTIALTEPIGPRVLLDGGEYPPRVVAIRAADVDPGMASPGPAVR